MSQSEQNSEVIYTRKLGWMPFVVCKNNALFLELGAGADANHEPRTFDIPITEAHLEVIKNDFVRHMLLWSAILPLCDAAGTNDPIDEAAATNLCDAILLGTEADIEALFKEIKWFNNHLIAHHADPSLLDKGEIFAATKTLSTESDMELAKEYDAKRRWERQGITLSALDGAVLRYTNQYFYGGNTPSRNPELTNPALLPQVLEIVAVADQAVSGMETPTDWKVGDGSWDSFKETAKNALRQAYPDLHEKAVDTIGFLMFSEAADRARARRKASA